MWYFYLKSTFMKFHTDIYLHTTEEMKQQAAAKINARFSKNTDATKEVHPQDKKSRHKPNLSQKVANTESQAPVASQR